MSSFEFFPEDSPRTISDPSQALLPEDIAVPAFRGFGHEVINAPLRGGASLLQAGALAAGGVDAPIDYLLGTHLSDGAFAVADRARAYREAHTLQPDEVGMASRIVGGAGEFLTQLALTGPAGAIGALELNTSADLARSGVDPFTSVAAGMTEAEGLALAFHIPGMGRGLASRVGLGVTANVGAGVLSRGAVGELLDQSGNPEQAKQFSAWNGEQMAVDAITGAFFGGVTHYQQRAAFAAINDHVQRVARSAPGEPLTADALDMHADRLDTAMQQVLADEPVTVSMPPSKFKPDPRREAMIAEIEAEAQRVFSEEVGPAGNADAPPIDTAGKSGNVAIDQPSTVELTIPLAAAPAQEQPGGPRTGAGEVKAPALTAAEADAIAGGDQRLPPDATHPEAQQDEFLVAHVRKIMGERAAVGRDIGEIVRDDGTTVDAHVALAEADADVRAAHELDSGARALANCEISHRGL